MFRWLWFQIFPGFEKKCFKNKIYKSVRRWNVRKTMESSCIKVYPSQAKNTVSREKYGQSPYYIFQQITSKIGTEIYATYVLHSGKSFQKWLKQSNFLHQGHWRKLASLQWQDPLFPKQNWSGVTNRFGWSLKRGSGRAGSANQIWKRQEGSSSRLFFSTSALTLEWWWAQIRNIRILNFFALSNGM